MSDPLNAHIHLSTEAPHRLRREEDREELEIRLRIWECWRAEAARESPHTALMRALDEYKRELILRALKRYGGGKS